MAFKSACARRSADGPVPEMMIGRVVGVDIAMVPVIHRLQQCRADSQEAKEMNRCCEAVKYSEIHRIALDGQDIAFLNTDPRSGFLCYVKEECCGLHASGLILSTSV